MWGIGWDLAGGGEMACWDGDRGIVGGEHGSLGLEFQGAGRIRLGRGEVGVHEKGLGLLGRFVFWCSLR